jgi:hypothetical protein
MVRVIPKFNLFAPIFCIISTIALIACEGSYDQFFKIITNLSTFSVDSSPNKHFHRLSTL